MNDTLILQENFVFLVRCNHIIQSKRKFAGTNIRQDGYFTACIAAYLSFWKTGLPYSVDVNGNPLTSISKEGCRCYNLETGTIEHAQLHFPVQTVVDKFCEYRKTFHRTHNAPTLLQVVDSLQEELANGTPPEELVAWDTFVDKCKIAALETKVSLLESDNQQLRLKAATNIEEAVRQLATYSDVVREGEDSYNLQFDTHVGVINQYDAERRRIRFERIRKCEVVLDWTQEKALKDAVKYHKYYLTNLFAFRFRSLPKELKSLPVETVNAVCGTNLKIYNPHEKSRFSI